MKVAQIKSYEGRNIFSHRPVVAMLVDLGRHDGRKTTDLPGFRDLLLEALPGLRTHHCASSRPGGFVRRLEDGTFLGHVIEHVALELQAMAGWPVVYGKTRQSETKGIYNVVFECGPIAGGVEAGRRAVEIVEALAQGRSPAVQPHLEAIQAAAEAAGLGPSTAAIAAEAAARGLPVRRLDRTSLLILGHGFRQRRVSATVTSKTPCPAVDLARDKVATKEVLGGAGIPVPPAVLAATRQEAAAALAALGPPVVVKPVDGNQGRGVALNLATPAEVRTAFTQALAFGERVMVEKQVFGRHYRLLVADGRLVAAAERLPARVVGDGRSTVAQLVEAVNRDPMRGDGHQRALTRITIDAICLLVLERQGLNPDAVAEAGRMVSLRDNANLSTGGTARDVTDEVHPENARLAVRASRLVGLDVAGVDIVAPEIARPIAEQGGVILEVNAAPGLRMHLCPSEGRPRQVAGPILDALFRGSERELPRGWIRRGPWAAQPGRIPTIAITGTNGKTTVSRLIAHILWAGGLVVGLASTAGAWVAGEKILDGDCAGPRTADAILMDPSVQAAVLETARGGIVRDGLAFDRCHVGVVTNISSDHEGQDGLDSLEDIAYVKALVVEAVARDGHAVLNADDPYVHRMAGRARCEVVFFSRSAENLVVRKHVLGGGLAIYLAGNDIVVDHGSRPVASFPLGEVPMTLGGLLPFQIENAIAAVAATWSLGAPAEAIRRGLRTFGLLRERSRRAVGYAANPGRFEAWVAGGRTVVVDYGHNRAAFTEALAATGRLCRGDLLAVVGAPGDRLDEHLLELGRLAARAADYVFIKEDQDTRGRARGEVASIFLRGVLDTGFPEARVEVILEERAALERAIQRARPDDWVIIFYEKHQPLTELLTSLRARAISHAALCRRLAATQGGKDSRSQGDRVPGEMTRAGPGAPGVPLAHPSAPPPTGASAGPPTPPGVL